MKKTIHVTFPEYTAAEYKQSINQINRDIYSDNSAYFVPRIFINFLSFLFFALCMTIGTLFFDWKFMDRLYESEGILFLQYTVCLGLCFVVYLILILFCTIDIKRKIYHRMHVRERTEGYSLSEFTERHDNGKQIFADYNFHETCDKLRGVDITDITFKPLANNDLCTVYVYYKTVHGLSSFMVSFDNIHISHRLQDTPKMDLWLDLEKKELIIYIPRELPTQEKSSKKPYL